MVTGQCEVTVTGFQAIAAELRLSVGTVRNHVSNIYFKTETDSRQELLKL